jgi:hypothetical protein
MWLGIRRFRLPTTRRRQPIGTRRRVGGGWHPGAAVGNEGNTRVVLTWEFNVNLGTILPLIFMAGAFYALTSTTLKALKDSVMKIEIAMAEQSKTIGQIAVQKERLDSQDRLLASTQATQALMDRRLYELARGKGWVRGHGGVDGEYTE